MESRRNEFAAVEEPREPRAPFAAILWSGGARQGPLAQERG